MFAITVPKFPAPTIPTGFSDELFETISDQAIVIIVERVEVAGDNAHLARLGVAALPPEPAGAA